MSNLIILRGNSGSGKSTTAIKIRYALGYETMLIPQDVVRREMLRTKDLPGNPSVQLIHDLAKYGQGIGYDVIIEGILPRDRYGSMLQEVIALFEHVYVYYFDIPFEETLERHKTKPNSHEFGEEEMRQWWAEKDALGVASEKIITDELSQDEIVSMILTDVSAKAI